ncbi:MAG: DUF1792 domain-containing protein [Lachnospiraceae bacterium]|nr:DUF1792 domain-containing protein [Lachnospiraceae bacterium]
MKKVYIWGVGYHAEYVYSMIDRNECTVEGFVDSDSTKQGMSWKNQITVYSPGQLSEMDYDYIIISIIKYESIEQSCKKLGIPNEKVIAFWKEPNDIKIFKNRIQEVLEERKKRKILENRLDSAPYEWGIEMTPQIDSAEKLLKKMIRDHSSLCRFGDGEFEIMRGNNRAWFQETSETLRRRLLQIIRSDHSSINIAVAQNFKNLERFNEEAADIIRDYMAFQTRKDILKFLDMRRSYYDAYVTRPYILYQDKENANTIFPLFKELWKGRSVIIVEGKYGRNGVNNDLFHTAHEMKRVLCPPQNAWKSYDRIKESILKIAKKDDLICISLGPAATVLAYDLAEGGYQAVDIGQVDNEYDWYIGGAKERMAIRGKMVAEYLENRLPEDIGDEAYHSQIMIEIE